jgi:DNA-binding transcriptional MocR family regulator
MIGITLAIEEGVEFAPGARFFSNPSEGEPFIRLNFATHTPQEIDEGIKRLKAALER